MLFQCLPELLLDRQVVLSLKTLALRRSTECRHRIYTCPEHKIPCRVERKIWVPFEETVPQRREGELFFSLGRYAYQFGRHEPYIRGLGIPCTFELNKKQRWSIFNDFYTPRRHPCFSQTGLYWLCHVAA